MFLIVKKFYRHIIFVYTVFFYIYIILPSGLLGLYYLINLFGFGNLI